MVLLECRGIDSTSVPAAEQLSPETCYTQTPNERYQSSEGNTFPAWRLDRDETPADVAATVDQPAALPSACGPQNSQPPAARWLPFKAANGTTFYQGPNGCAGIAPEESLLDNSEFPSNATYGITTTNGTGSAKFVVETDESNASLGCSQTVACSLVVVPVMGISCDNDLATPANADMPANEANVTPRDIADDQADCDGTGNYAAGQSVLQPDLGDELSVSGSLWWSASNWQGRISVPLTFATPSDVCTSSATQNALSVYGTQLMYEAALQWEPYFCLNPKSFDWNLVSTSEPEAANLLNTGGVQAVMASDPPIGGFTRHVVQAPAAVTGFGIAYDIDDPHQHDVPTLHLDARLLAKLLTESYLGDSFMKTDDPGLASNPIDITQDPEFRLLNPSVDESSPEGEVGAALLQVSQASDVITALTSYINADPEARAWLDGAPDPWGMVVNPAYKKIALPISRWPLLDTVVPAAETTGTNVCYYQPGVTRKPAPWMSLVDNPAPNFTQVAFDMQYALPQTQTFCYTPDPTSNAGAVLTTPAREDPGHRFMLGVVSLGDAQEYQLDTASLQTANVTPPGAEFSAADRTFVAPTTASLLDAARSLVPDTATGGYSLPTGSAVNNAAYPGTMLVNLDVPTGGLSPSTAKDLAQLMRFTADTGQVPGFGNGQLPPGYLPITAAEGLSDLLDYTDRAAADVAAQNGDIPSSAAASSSPSTATTTSPSTSTASAAAPSAGGTTESLPATTRKAQAADTANPPEVAGPERTGVAGTLESLLSAGLTTGAVGLIVPGLVLLGALALAAARISAGLTRRRSS